MYVQIFKVCKTPTQSGDKDSGWKIVFKNNSKRQINPITGWTSAYDTNQQLNLYFSSKDAAVEYAIKKGYQFEILGSSKKTHKPKSYSDNFL